MVKILNRPGAKKGGAPTAPPPVTNEAPAERPKIDTSEADAFLSDFASKSAEQDEDALPEYNIPEFKRTDDPDGGALKYLKDMYGDTEQQEKNNKAHQARLAIMGVGDALRHLGNIYHTSKGAPSQKLTSSVPIEDARYDKKQLAEQEKRRKQAELSFKIAKERADRADKERNYELKYAKAEWDAKDRKNKEARARKDDARKDAVERRNQELHGAKKRKAEADAERAAIDAKNRQRYFDDQHNNTVSAIHHRKVTEAQNAQRIAIQKANAANKGKGKGGGKGSGNPKVRLSVKGDKEKGTLLSYATVPKDEYQYMLDRLEDEGALPEDIAARMLKANRNPKEIVHGILRDGGKSADTLAGILQDEYGFEYDGDDDDINLSIDYEDEEDGWDIDL